MRHLRKHLYIGKLSRKSSTVNYLQLFTLKRLRLNANLKRYKTLTLQVIYNKTTQHKKIWHYNSYLVNFSLNDKEIMTIQINKHCHSIIFIAPIINSL